MLSTCFRSSSEQLCNKCIESMFYFFEQEANDAGFGTGAFIDELHKRMEGVVLGMANGSYTQRVLAEYLKEVEERAKEVFPKVEK